MAELCHRNPTSPYWFACVVMSCATSRTYKSVVNSIVARVNGSWSAYKSRKREFSDEEVCAPLVLSDLTEGDSPGPEPFLLPGLSGLT